MKRNKLLTILLTVVGLLVVVVASFVVLVSSRVRNEVTVNVGEEVSIDEFRRYSWDKGVFTWIEEPDTSSCGEKKGKIQVFPITYQVKLIVSDAAKNPGDSDIMTTNKPTIKPDTTAPVVTTRKITMYAEEYYNNGVTPEEFIEEVKDESAYTVESIPQPAIESYGNGIYRFVVKDNAGNSTEVEAELCIINLVKKVTIELGNKLPVATEFLYRPASEVSFVTNMDTINVMAEGMHEITLLVNGIEAVSILEIQDTIAPTLVLHPAETWLNKPLDPTAFIDFELSYDNSDAFDNAYTAEPDWTSEGEQIITVTATDASGNSSSETTTLTVKRDTKPPVVTVTDIDVKVGGTVSYKKAVSYYDDIDSKEEMKLSIERGGVNLKEVGSYEVTYTVTDCSGNSTSVVGKINVLAEAPKWEDEDAIHAKAREILDSILEDGMTDREKAKAIYKWTKNNIGYVNHSEKGNYIRGAYEGLFKKEGDCFVYASTAKELLTLAGIQNIDIVKATKNPSHYWNLVYIEDGWYHFDTTPRKDKSEFFLLTDAELEAYSSTHKNTHIFDRSLYPEIK